MASFRDLQVENLPRARSVLSFTARIAGVAAACAMAACSAPANDLDSEVDISVVPGSPDLSKGVFPPKEEDGSCPGAASGESRCGCGPACLLTQVCHEGACVDQPTDCSMTGTCNDPTCNEPRRYSVDEKIAADLSYDRRLWQRESVADLDYPHAVAYCESLELDGVTGWRLPDGAESGSIVFRAGGLQGCTAPKYCVPAIDQAVFPGTQVDLYWTSLAYMPGMHFARSFCDGRSTPNKEDDSTPHNVRCVHDPIPVH